MASNGSPADAIVPPPRPTSTRTSSEKPGAIAEATAVESAASTEKAAAARVEVGELVESPPKSRWKNYTRSVRETFSVRSVLQLSAVLLKLARFVGPGSIISVAYIDPDNFQTALSSGAQFGFALLFMILVSNLISIFLQVKISREPLVV
jgi:metal iron transporter